MGVRLSGGLVSLGRCQSTAAGDSFSREPLVILFLRSYRLALFSLLSPGYTGH